MTIELMNDIFKTLKLTNDDEVKEIQNDTNKAIWYIRDSDILPMIAEKIDFMHYVKEYALKHNIYIWSGYNGEKWEAKIKNKENVELASYTDIDEPNVVIKSAEYFIPFVETKNNDLVKLK